VSRASDRDAPPLPYDRHVWRKLLQRSGLRISDLQGATGELTELVDALSVPVRNETGSDIAANALVYVSGANSDGEALVALADADDAAKMPAMGFMRETTATALNGRVVLLGHLRDMALPDGTYDVGDELYVSATAGAFTKTAPTGASDTVQRVAVVTKVGDDDGEAFVTGPSIDNNVSGTLVGLGLTAAAGKLLANPTAGAAALQEVGLEPPLTYNGSTKALHIATGDIATAMIADGAVNATLLATGAVETAAIDANAVTSAKIAAGAVGTTQLAADAVTGAKIADDAVGSEHLADDAVGSAAIADGAVDTARLGADAVTGAKLADDAVGSEHIADDAVVAAAIADGAVDASRLATNAVTTVKITDANVTAAKLATDAKVSTMLAVGTSTASVANTTIYASWDTASSDALADSTGNIQIDDEDSGTDTSDNTIINIAAAGRYQIDCSFRISGNNRVEAFCRTWLDTGSGFVRQSMHTASNYSSRDTDQNTGSVTLSTILSLSSGDKLKFQAEADADGTANMVVNGTLLRIIRHV
jgi:hypothetical protein